MLLGVRHHGPGSARAVLAALERCAPKAVLIEGPPEGDALLPLAADPRMRPPVALLAHVANEPGRAAFWPLAEFSPEWVAIRWALRHDVPVRFIDLPAAHTLALTGAGGEAGADAPGRGGPDAAVDGDTPEDAGDAPRAGGAPVRVDPLAALAAAAGYDDPERWWEDVVEHRGEAAPDDETDRLVGPARALAQDDGPDGHATARARALAPFAAIGEAMAVLRAEHEPAGPDGSAAQGGPDSRGEPDDRDGRGDEGGPGSADGPDRDAVREAHMRLRLREARREFGDDVAVVCGAWHVPALTTKTTVAADRGLLRGLPKAKVELSWVPWTHRRLSRASGYGAGITSPGWYGHLFGAPDRPVERWLTKVAGLLREEDYPVSTAHVIEAVRLADTLAVLRGRPLAGLTETTDAIRSVLCEGSDVPLSLVRERLVVGDDIGEVPDTAPATPLQRDLARAQRALRLKPTATDREMELDLRKETDAERSALLHRLGLLGIAWGVPARNVRANAGTFRETWRLRWEPELAVRVAEAGVWGTTVRSAATARAAALAVDAEGLADVTELAERCLLAGLPDALPVVMRVLADRAALAADVGHLAQALPALVRSVRYGDVRGTDAAALGEVAVGLAERVCVGLPPACVGLDADGAEEMRGHLDAAHRAIGLLAETRAPAAGPAAPATSGTPRPAGPVAVTDDDNHADAAPGPAGDESPRATADSAGTAAPGTPRSTDRVAVADDDHHPDAAPGSAGDDCPRAAAAPAVPATRSEPGLRTRWTAVLRVLAERDGTPGLIRGRAARLLLDDSQLADGEAARLMGLALSPGTPPVAAAAWIEGFVGGGAGGGMLLVHDERLLGLVDDWLCGVAPEAFTDVLPLLRRTFSTYEEGVRRTLGELVRRGPGGARAGTTAAAPAAGFGPDTDLERARAVLPTLWALLGIDGPAPAGPHPAPVAATAADPQAAPGKQAVTGEQVAPREQATTGQRATAETGEPAGAAATAVASAGAHAACRPAAGPAVAAATTGGGSVRAEAPERDGDAGAPASRVPDAERLRRWRLVLGGGDGADGTGCALDGRDAAMDRTLEALYGASGAGGASGRGKGGTAGGQRSAGLGDSAPRVARWLGDIRTYFPTSVVQVMQRDAIDRLGLSTLLLEPEMLAAVEADVHLVGTLLSLNEAMPETTKETARAVVRKVVEDLEKRLSSRTRATLNGALDRSARVSRPRHQDIDWNRTIRANLGNYLPEYRTVIPERLIGYGRAARGVKKDVILCIDQSGSMAASVVYASVFGAVLASMRSLATRLVVFDTAVVDLTDELDDPVDVLFGTQLGGGTDINRALAYCQSQITRPADTVVVLISDLYEGGIRDEMLGRVAAMKASGVQFVTLLALSDEGAPSYDREHAGALAALGAPAFACTPDLFPDVMAAAIERRQLPIPDGESHR
ncbi:DUF5682 family protein [Streptomyces sp. 71268]|uniref:DUF5682 family protein n=1 Tax=Streptomyces sp. 71268 TaxID=3002640 RepID=UPI0023FA040F|nr:DUF5682 family protein [Streptomyces sp. 71268]WEV29874.1 DUF5682 family protein [Streptomyces sp. 71268]